MAGRFTAAAHALVYNPGNTIAYSPWDGNLHPCRPRLGRRECTPVRFEVARPQPWKPRNWSWLAIVATMYWPLLYLVSRFDNRIQRRNTQPLAQAIFFGAHLRAKVVASPAQSGPDFGLVPTTRAVPVTVPTPWTRPVPDPSSWVPPNPVSAPLDNSCHSLLTTPSIPLRRYLDSFPPSNSSRHTASLARTQCPPSRPRHLSGSTELRVVPKPTLFVCLLRSSPSARTIAGSPEQHPRSRSSLLPSQGFVSVQLGHSGLGPIARLKRTWSPQNQCDSVTSSAIQASTTFVQRRLPVPTWPWLKLLPSCDGSFGGTAAIKEQESTHRYVRCVVTIRPPVHC